MTWPELPGADQLQTGDTVVLDYLAALWAAGADLHPEQRDELMSLVAEYIALRRTAGSRALTDPAQIISRLGPPGALVASAERGRMPVHLRRPPSPGHPAARRSSRPAAAAPPGASDHAAVVLLTVGGLILPGLSPLAAMAVVSGSPRWPTAQKAGAWVLAAGSTGIGLMMLLIALVSVGSSLPLLLAYVIAAGGSLVTGLFLLPGLITRR